MTAQVCCLRLPAVLQRRGCSRATLYRAVADGTFVPPKHRGRRTSIWYESEVNAVLAAEEAGATEDELRRLVSQLVAGRGGPAPGENVVPSPRDAAGKFVRSEAPHT